MLIVWFLAYKKLAQFAVQGALPPRRSESPVCSTDNNPSCVLHLLGWFIGSRGFSSLERRPEFWVLHINIPTCKQKRLDQTISKILSKNNSFQLKFYNFFHYTINILKLYMSFTNMEGICKEIRKKSSNIWLGTRHITL